MRQLLMGLRKLFPLDNAALSIPKAPTLWQKILHE